MVATLLRRLPHPEPMAVKTIPIAMSATFGATVMSKKPRGINVHVGRESHISRDGRSSENFLTKSLPKRGIIRTNTMAAIAERMVISKPAEDIGKLNCVEVYCTAILIEDVPMVLMKDARIMATRLGELKVDAKDLICVAP